MPIYEFYSPDSHRIYSFFARRMLKGGEVPCCPDGLGYRMEKLVSSFACTGKAREVVKTGGGSEAGMDPRMEREMMMMRRMMEASGQKLPGEMGEMLQRLEKGENPDKLEEEYGDVMEKMEGVGDEKKEDLKMRLRKRLPARRDPKLYEWEEFLVVKRKQGGAVRKKISVSRSSRG